MRTFALLLVIASAGCARMGTHQTDRTSTTTIRDIDETSGKVYRLTTTENRETTTRASGTAVISSSTTFQGLDASQDGRNQGLKVKDAAMRSDVDRAIDMIGKLAPLAGALTGVPIPAARQDPPQAAPAGRKWVLVPTDDPSTPQPEVIQ